MRADNQHSLLYKVMWTACRESVRDKDRDVGVARDPGLGALGQVGPGPLLDSLHLVDDQTNSVTAFRADVLEDVPALTDMLVLILREVVF